MIAIVLHLHYHDLWDEFKEKIIPVLSETTHLYVTINHESDCIDDIRHHAKEVFTVENKGMDIGPFIFTYNKIQDTNYKYIVKLHTKKSLHSPGLGDWWRTGLVDSILHSNEHFNHMINFMETNPDIFMAGSEAHFHNKLREPYDHPNRLEAIPAIEKVNTVLNVTDHGSFFAGSMFVATTHYLNILFNNIDLEAFYNEFTEGYARGGTLAHGMERVIGYGVEKYEGRYLTL
jgi:lipopolysaccharide biosynthesis protein